MKTVLENPWVRALGVVLALVLLCLLAYALKPVLIPLFLALIVAYVLDPVVDFFEARRIPRMATIIGLAAVAVVLALSIPIIIVPSIFHQAGTLIASARGVYSFEQIDANNNGKISEDELITKARGFDRNDFIIADFDHDNVILKVEWDAYMRSSGGSVRRSSMLDTLLDYLPVNRLVKILDLDKPAPVALELAPADVDTPAADATPIHATKPDGAIDSTPTEGSLQTTEAPPAPVVSAAPAAPVTTPDESAAVSTDEAPAEEPAVTESLPAEPIDKVDARALLAEYIGKNVRDFAIEFMKTHASSLASFGQRAGVNIFGFATSVGQGLVDFLLFLANFALFAIVAGYLLKDFDPLKATARTLIPPRYAPKTLSILGKIDVQLRSFLRGQMTVCFLLGIMYTIGFLICGVPFAIIIGMFSIIASFIPFVGVATTAVLGILLTLLQHGTDWHIVGVLVVVGLVQFLEGNILTPRIVGEQVGLNPVWVILAIMVFGNFLGFLGLLLAVPIAAALKVLVVEGVAYYRASPVFAGGAGVVESEAPDDETSVRRKKRR
ncbi:MAG: AI-2E family transporter [Candidatus Hydrogenedentes bacterium]|nr:AI-2E family transporter [Candidatus Hydrogenedentota bacterium]